MGGGEAKGDKVLRFYCTDLIKPLLTLITTMYCGLCLRLKG